MNSFLNRVQKRDDAILMLFNNSMNCKFLNIIMPVVTYVGSSIFAILFCIATFFNVHTRVLSLETALALIVSSIAVRIIKINVNRLRPYLILKNLNIRKIGIDNYSFPSGHTTCAFCIAAMLSLNFPSLLLISFLTATSVGLSRMYLGVHYPSDVFIGILIALATSYTIFSIV
jgi:undecaprenyl-diphosphatase